MSVVFRQVCVLGLIGLSGCATTRTDGEPLRAGEWRQQKCRMYEQLALQCLRAGDSVRARSLLQQAVAFDEQEWRTLELLARLAYNEGDLATAGDAARLLLQRRPEAASSWCAMAAVAEASDDLREAERCHLEAVARAGEDAGPWIALHRFYLDADRPTDAERIREQLDRRFPERVDPWLDSASYHAVRGRWTEAMSAWAHVLERQPRNAEVAARCALAALAADRPGAARELVERMPPHARAADPALTLSLVGAHLEEEDWALALRELDLLQPRGEQGAALRTLRGEILCRLGRSDEATAELEAAVELDPSLARAHATLGRIRLAEGRTHAGVRALQRAVALAPGDGVSHGLLAARLAADGDLPLAARHLAAARRCDGARRLSARVEQMFPELAPLTADPSYR